MESVDFIVNERVKWITNQCNNINKGKIDCNSKKNAIDNTRRSKEEPQLDNNGSFLQMKQVLRRWTENCQELYNYELRTDTRFLENMSSTIIETGHANTSGRSGGSTIQQTF